MMIHMYSLFKWSKFFYVQDPKNTNWHAFVKVKPLDLFNMVNEVLTYENFKMPISSDISIVNDHPN